MLRRYLFKTYKRLPSRHKELIKKLIRKIPFLYGKYFYTNRPRLANIQRHKFSSFDYEKIGAVPYKIAINIHLYYIDLLDEFIAYCNNMPYAYDLLITVTNIEFVDIIRNKQKQLKKLNILLIKFVPNRGRDVASFIVHFARELLNYDIVCHVHSKKSLHTGGEQNDWRNYLLHNLLGSTATVKNIFALFHNNDKVGLIYPESFFHLPYWAHTWLQNRSMGFNFLRELGVIPSKNKYIDYPLGTFFWARVSAIKSLLKNDIKLEDFPEEFGQNDKTLAHVIERGVVPIIVKENYDFAVVDMDKKSYSINFGERNLWQYWSLGYNKLISKINDYSIISFDIFDTLITRNLVNPDFLFEVLEKQIKSKYGIKDFANIRKQAEDTLRIKSNYMHDCNLSEIYQQIANRLKLDLEIATQLLEMEINLELQVSVPRSDVINAFNYAKEKGKDLLLISDMYLSTDYIENLLRKHGIVDYNKLFISCELNKRKDNGSMWEWLKTKYDVRNLLHVGDNEVSDIQNVGDAGIASFHVMSPADLFELSDLYFLDNLATNYADKLILGLMVQKLFNSPFDLRHNNGKLAIDNLADFTYTFIAPLILKFMQWFVTNIQHDKIDNILFLAREGYLLNDIYALIVKYQSKLPENKYFLVSRRAVSIASIKTKDDVFELLHIPYDGQFIKLLCTRYGIKCAEVKDFAVILPRDYDKIKNLLSTYLDQIIENAKIERVAYTEYINSLELDGKLAVVDLGYSGTIQYYMSKLLEVGFTGYYFVLNNDHKATRIPNNVMKACFANNQDDVNPNNITYRFHLILEQILTALNGQLINFDENAKPVFKDIDSKHLDEIKQMHSGILDFVRDYFTLLDTQFIDEEISQDFVEELFLFPLVNNSILSASIKNAFILEDEYCSDTNVNLFEALNLI